MVNGPPPLLAVTDTQAMLAVVLLVLLIITIPGWCMIAKRLGYDQIAGLLMLIPLVNLGVFLYWAFTESPNERKLRSLKTTKAHQDR